jgi:hypothetical protein
MTTSTQQREYYLTPKGYVGRLALHEGTADSFAQFNALWPLFEDWLWATKSDFRDKVVSQEELMIFWNEWRKSK